MLDFWSFFTEDRPMKVGYYGYDNVFKSLLPPIIRETEDVRGYVKGVWLPPQIRGVAAERKLEIADCDAVLLGLSSFQTQEELVLVGAAKRVVVIADAPGSELRPKAQAWVREQAMLPKAQRKLRGVIIALESARQGAIDFGYPPEDIYYVGPPPHWGVSYRQMMEIDIGAVRSSLVVRRGQEELQPFVSEDVLVYVAGTKMPLVVNAMLRCAITAGRELFGHRFVLGFAPHPGERAEKQEDEEMFAQAFAERAKMREGLREADVSKISNPQRYAVADLVITTGGPTETLAAAYARNTNVVYYRDAAVVMFLVESGVQEGKWFVPDYGGAYLVGPETFLDGVRFAMSPEGKAYLLKQQEENFPLPETWDTAPAIVDVLEFVGLS